MSVYEDNGFESRQDYLEDLADTYDVDIETVLSIAGILGESEDFDGLVSTVQDMSRCA